MHLTRHVLVIGLASVFALLPDLPAATAPRAAPIPPDHANVRYGPHERNVFDLWLPKSTAPAPIVLFIHGGGFRRGDKSGISQAALRSFLAEGWAVAAINYRFIDTAPAPAAYLDCGRALQHLRHHAARWKLDPNRVASTGSSAGAGTSLWLALHNDLADPGSSDPIARQSTRLTCVAVANGQSSYDPRFSEKIGMPRPNFERHEFFLEFYAITAAEIDTPKAYARYEAAAPITHLDRGDPPVLMTYSRPNEPVTAKTSLGTIVHHPLLGIALRREMSRLGLECIVQYRGADGGTVQEPATSGGRPITAVEFFQKHFAAAAK